MTDTTQPRPPRGLGKRGRRFWTTTLADYELTAGELELLTEVCRRLDSLDALDAAVREDGTMIASSQGMRLHPAIAEARAVSLAVARLLAQLALPDEAGGALPTSLQAAARAREARNRALSRQSRVGA